ncbi:MAG: glycosyltransferase family 4 protein [Vicinamibacterales bacterium]
MSSSSIAPRVVLFTTYFHPIIGGVETHARHLARGLAAAGLDVWVLTKQIDATTPCDDLVDGVRVRRIPPSGPRKSSAKWKVVPWAFQTLLRERHSFDVILCIDYRGIGVAALAAGRLLGKPVVFDAETPGALSCGNWDPALSRLGLRRDGRLASLVKAPVRWLYGGAHAYACISREIEREALDRGIPDPTVRYLPHTVDTLAFRPPTPVECHSARQALGLPLDKQVVAFVGRLGREKGILDLLGAWRSLDRQDAVLFVVGPEMPGNALDVGPEVRTTAASFAPGRVVLHGPATDVRPMLAAADVFVQPSHYEAFGISVIEAMATARPIVATRVGGMAEYLRNGENALLCEPHEVHGLGTQIAKLLDDRKLASRLGACARATAEQDFDERLVTGRWVELIRSLAPGDRDGLSRAVASAAMGLAPLTDLVEFLEALA